MPRDGSTLTYVLNNLTRGLGLADAYPFVLSEPTVRKLRFVCESMTAPASPAAVRPIAEESIAAATPESAQA